VISLYSLKNKQKLMTRSELITLLKVPNIQKTFGQKVLLSFFLSYLSPLLCLLTISQLTGSKLSLIVSGSMIYTQLWQERGLLIFMLKYWYANLFISSILIFLFLPHLLERTTIFLFIETKNRTSRR
jgi:hypothetical protein